MVTSWLPDKFAMTTSTANHPLELIAPFRRWPPSPLRNLVYTARWNSLIGLALALAGWAFTQGARFDAMLGPMVLTSNLVGFAIHAGLFTLRSLAPSVAPGWRARTMRLGEGLLIACCAVVGLALADALLRGHAPFGVMLHSATLAPAGLAIALSMMAVHAAGQRRLAREMQAALREQQIAEAGRLLAEARLRAL